MTEAKRETPCIGVCLMDTRTALCRGCGRTLQEIARWARMDGTERRAIMASLDQRMQAAGLSPLEQPQAR